jgi:glutathione S-transferase
VTAFTLIGRQSSHYSRTVRIFAAELGVEYRLTPVVDLMSLDAHTFAENPALKLPVLRADDDYIYGTLNICRVLAQSAVEPKRIGWPESFATPLLMNAHELLAHAMGTEVEIVMHEVVAHRPPDNASRKRRASLVNCLVWLDTNLEAIRSGLDGHDLSYLEVGLYCLLEHIPFRNPMDLSGMPRLLAFGAEFGARASAQATPYQFDK